MTILKAKNNRLGHNMSWLLALSILLFLAGCRDDSQSSPPPNLTNKKSKNLDKSTKEDFDSLKNEDDEDDEDAEDRKKTRVDDESENENNKDNEEDWDDDSASTGPSTGSDSNAKTDNSGGSIGTGFTWEDFLKKLGISIGGLGGDPFGKATSCVDGDSFTCEVEAVIVKACNDERAKSGATELKQNFEVSYVARDWSKKQAASGGISHNGFPSERKAVFSQKFTDSPQPPMSGENVAMTMAWSKDASAVGRTFVTMWMGSLGHRANIMGLYRAIGVGVYCDGMRCFATQIFNR